MSNIPLIFIVIAMQIACCSNTANGQTYKPRLLRFEEDYSGLTDSVVNAQKWLKTKNRIIDVQKPITASFGLDYREMYELVKRFDTAGISDGYWLTRFMTHADINIGKKWGGFFQIARCMVAARQLPVRAVDIDELFFLNAFVDYRFGKTRNKYVRLGRQELFFGMGRLIAPREGPNVRSTYDAIRIHYKTGAVVADGFYAKLVENRPGILNNKVLGGNQILWGIYSTIKGNGRSVDAYYLGYYNPLSRYSKQASRAPETRHSIGTRWYGKVLNTIIYDTEIVYQFGKFGNNNIHAFMVDGKISRDIKLQYAVLKPSIKIGYFSGNRSIDDDRLTTYNPLFPNLLYYQTAVGIFPSNIINPQINMGWEYGNLSIVGGADLFWRASNNDGLYAPFGTLQLATSNESYLGYQLYSKADYSFTKNLTCTFLVSNYFKSDFIKRNSDRRGIDLLVNVLLNYKI